MILDDLVLATRKRIEEEKKVISFEKMKEMALYAREKDHKENDFSFRTALSGPGIHFICEVKKASPSKGIIAEDFPYLAIAKEYEKIGADAISVLTEPDYFKGNIRYLQEIKEAGVQIPLLRKDFTIDEYMIYQAKCYGASAILLICAILDDKELAQYHQLAASLGLSAIVEVHDEEEVKRAILAGAEIVGVNNRNLKDFTVDLNNSVRLRKLVPEDKIFVAESGIKTEQDMAMLRDAGVNAVLIGETMMRSEDKEGMITRLKTIDRSGTGHSGT